jgi:hypothetical protein
MSRKCVNNPDMFRYVCGELTVKAQRLSIMPLVKKAYKLYFGCNVRDQDKPLASHVRCGTCASKLKKLTTRFATNSALCSTDGYGLSKMITSETVISV